MLKPSVLMSLPVEEEKEEEEKQQEGEQLSRKTKLLCCQLTLGDDLVEDSLEFQCRDVHVLNTHRGQQTTWSVT